MTQSAIGRFDGPPINFIRLALRARVPLSIVTMVCGALGLITSFAGVDIFLQPLDGRSATHPITGLAMIGLGLCILKTRRFGKHGLWRIMVLGTILLVCAARVMDAVLSWGTGAPALAALGPVEGFNGRFSIESALTIGAFSVATLVRQGNGRVGGLFLVAGLALVFTTVLQMSYGLVFFNGDVGVLTFLGLLSASLAMLSIYLHRPFVRVAFMMGDIGVQTRVMVVSIVLIPWLSGLGLTWSGAMEGETHAAAMISVITCAMLAILLTTSARHEGSVAARRRAARELALFDRIDPVTGALNRFGMTEVVEGSWVDFRSSGAQFGMILMDVDYFRNIDATFGAGDPDAALERVAQSVQGQLRGTDALGRWGTSEFLILLKIKEVGNIDIVARRLRAALADVTGPFCAGLTMQPATLDIPLGISDMRETDDAPTAAIMRADQSLGLSRLDETSTVPVMEFEEDDVFVFSPDATMSDEEQFARDAALDMSSEPEEDDSKDVQAA
ncbi:sensor domain-containing diguanylate cyclase [Pseudooctadecabacter sp.]|uniref:GGDEF domain-containing protein n=1 Tax=Pseudooctadecabacter sp. TaxID=1966338 RepID=UPI0025F736BA|nr:GGDEF domain-containing protein [Pseudooctadecabacter sp.]